MVSVMTHPYVVGYDDQGSGLVKCILSCGFGVYGNDYTIDDWRNSPSTTEHDYLVCELSFKLSS